MASNRNILKVTSEEKKHIYLSSAFGIGSAPGTVKSLVDAALAHVPETWTFFAGAATFGGIAIAGMGLGYYRSKAALKEAENKISEIEKNLFLTLNMAADLYDQLEEKYPAEKTSVLLALEEQVKTMGASSLLKPNENHIALGNAQPIFHDLSNFYAALNKETRHHFNKFDELIRGFTTFRKTKPALKLFWEQWKQLGFANNDEMNNAFVEANSLSEITSLLTQQMTAEKSQILHDIDRIKTYFQNANRILFLKEAYKHQQHQDNLLEIFASLEEDLNRSDFSFFGPGSIKIGAAKIDFPGNLNNIEQRLKNMRGNFQNDDCPLNIVIYKELNSLLNRLSHLKRKKDLRQTWLENQSEFNIQSNLFGANSNFRNYLIENTEGILDYKGKNVPKTELAFVGIFMAVGIYKAADLIASSLFLLGASNILGPIGLSIAIVGLTIGLSALGLYSYYKSKTIASSREMACEAIKTQRINLVRNNNYRHQNFFSSNSQPDEKNASTPVSITSKFPIKTASNATVKPSQHQSILDPASNTSGQESWRYR